MKYWVTNLTTNETYAMSESFDYAHIILKIFQSAYDGRIVMMSDIGYLDWQKELEGFKDGNKKDGM